jgi:hypothetical protein
VLADYYSMYLEGSGGAGNTFNGDCRSPGAPGCWGHRNNILNSDCPNQSTSTCVMGAAQTTISSGRPGGLQSIAEALGVYTAAGSPPSNAMDFLNSSLIYPGGSAPQVSRISPASGAANTAVTISGAHLSGATAVDFGGFAASGVHVQSDNTVTAVAPSGPSGTVAVTVTTPHGTSSGAGAQFTYRTSIGPPTITSSTPTSGPAGGGTSVTISGRNFATVRSVSFGSTPAASYVVDSASQITAVSPRRAGTVRIRVVTAQGTAVSPGSFTFVAPHPPSIFAVKPSSGPTGGGTAVTINGANFSTVTAVSFGTVAAARFTVDSPTRITAVTPAEGARSVNIKVTSAQGSALAPGRFTFVAPPSPG